MMKKKIAKEIVRIAEKAALWSAEKSILIGAYEIKPVKELLDKKRCRKE